MASKLNESTLQVLIPGALAFLDLVGIIVIDLAGRPIPDVLLVNFGVFALWATGSALKNRDNGNTK